MSERKIVLYIATSLDNFIAGENDDLDFLEKVHREGEDYGYAEFEKSIDTVILGRRTYETVINMGIEFPHKDKMVFVITSQERKPEGHVQFFNGDLLPWLAEMKKKDGKNIFLDGGAGLVEFFLHHGLIDEFIISVVPVLLGKGIRLFGNSPRIPLKLVESKAFDSGLVQLHYLAE